MCERSDKEAIYNAKQNICRVPFYFPSHCLSQSSYRSTIIAYLSFDPFQYQPTQRVLSDHCHLTFGLMQHLDLDGWKLKEAGGLRKLWKLQ